MRDLFGKAMRLPNALMVEFIAWLSAVVMWLPGRIGVVARVGWLRLLGAHIGADCHIEAGLWIRGAAHLQIGNACGFGRGVTVEATAGEVLIGNRVTLNQGVILNADFGKIRIEDHVLIGMNTVFRAANHRVDRSPEILIRDQGHEGGEIVVKSDVWLGANVVVLPGVTIGSHSVVAAGSVVTKDVPPMTVVGGIPAKVLRTVTANAVSAGTCNL